MATTSNTAFPLAWPAGKPRTPEGKRRRSNFQAVEYFAAYRDLAREVRLIPGVRDVVVSTNVPLKRNGEMYAGQKAPDDPGVAVYFTYRSGKQMAMACDLWLKVGENLRALAHTVAALRGIERWGGGGMVDAVFTGFQALPGGSAPPPPPPPPPQTWWHVLGVQAWTPTAEVVTRIRTLLLECHPDRNGGDDAKFKTVREAEAKFKKERGL